MLTAKTITDAQIRALREYALNSETEQRASDIIIACEKALAYDHAARARCAEIFNRGIISLADVADALKKGATERRAAERTLKRSPRR